MNGLQQNEPTSCAQKTLDARLERHCVYRECVLCNMGKDLAMLSFHALHMPVIYVNENPLRMLAVHSINPLSVDVAVFE